MNNYALLGLAEVLSDPWEVLMYSDKILAIDANNKFAWNDKGWALDPSQGALGNYTQAIQYYDKALAIDPNFKMALYNKGHVFEHQGDYTQAIQYYDKALAIDPNFKMALDHKQAVLSRMGNGRQQQMDISMPGRIIIIDNRTRW